MIASTALFNFYHCKEFTLPPGDTEPFLVREYSVRATASAGETFKFLFWPCSWFIRSEYPPCMRPWYGSIAECLFADVGAIDLEKALNYLAVGHLKFLFDSY